MNLQSHRLSRAAVGLCLAFIACNSADNSTTIVLTNGGQLAVSTESYLLPAQLSQTSLSIQTTTTLGPIIGSPTGLYELRGDAFEFLAEGAVTGIVSYSDSQLVVAKDEQLWIWDGTLGESLLNEVLGDDALISLGGGSEQIWFATANQLYRYYDQAVDSLEMSSVTRIQSFGSQALATIQTSSGEYHLLNQISSEEWEIQSVDDEGVDAIFPSTSSSVYGLVEGRLKQRIQAGTASVQWIPIALNASDRQEGSSGIEAMGVDATTGALWVIDSSSIYRLIDDRVYSTPRPLELPIVSLFAISSEGSLWLSDGTSLIRLRPTGNIPSFAQDIQSFAQENCIRCHDKEDRARNLETYDDWVREIDRAIVEVQAGRMPADNEPLSGGTLDLLIQWRDGGLRP